MHSFSVLHFFWTLCRFEFPMKFTFYDKSDRLIQLEARNGAESLLGVIKNTFVVACKIKFWLGW